EVRWERTAIGVGCFLIICERAWPTVCWNRWTHATFCGRVSYFILSRKCLNLLFRERRTVVFRQVAEREKTRTVAARTNFTEDLEAALKLVLIVGAEQTAKRPILTLNWSTFAGGEGWSRSKACCDCHCDSNGFDF